MSAETPGIPDPDDPDSTLLEVSDFDFMVSRLESGRWCLCFRFIGGATYRLPFDVAEAFFERLAEQLKLGELLQVQMNQVQRNWVREEPLR